MIQVQDWAEIRHLYFAEELSQRVIAVGLGVARRTVGFRSSDSSLEPGAACAGQLVKCADLVRRFAEAAAMAQYVIKPMLMEAGRA